MSKPIDDGRDDRQPIDHRFANEALAMLPRVIAICMIVAAVVYALMRRG